MRIVRASVVLLLCLVITTPAAAQLPTPGAGQPPPPAGTQPPPAGVPSTPQVPPVTTPPAGPMSPSPAPGAPMAPTPSPGATGSPTMMTPSPVVTTPPPPPDTPLMQRVLGRALSQDEAVAIALETQPSIQARLSDYMAASYRVDQAFAPLLPQLTGTATLARTQTVTSTRETRQIFIPDGLGGGTIGSRTGSARTVYSIREPDENTSMRVSLSQIIFDFGKTFASTDAARRLAEQAQEDVELQRQLVTQTVKESFTNINFAQRLIRVQEQAVERAQLNLRSARGFFEVGTRPKSDVARAEVDVANARVDLIRARNAERLARVALNTAMGIPAETPTQVQDNLVYQPIALDASQLQVRALNQRPEYKTAKLRVSEAEARAKRAFRDFFPDLTGSGYYGSTRFDMNEIWEVAVSLSWTLYDGGSRIARFRESKVNVEGAEARVRATALDISREVEQAYIVVSEAGERIQAAQVAVTSAQENFRLAQGRFDAGVGTILELTDAQLALTQTQNAEAQALADYRIAVVRLERALGQR